VSLSVRSVPAPQVVLSVRDIRLYAFAALFTAGNLVAPALVHSIPKGGFIFLPIFFFTLIAAYRFGFAAGALTGLASPLANYALTGMPPATELPTVVVQSLLLAAIAAFAASHSDRVSIVALFGAAVAMQLAGFAIGLARGGTVPAGVDILRLGIPGVVLMVAGGYLVLRLLERSQIGESRTGEARG
jgi:hypothetical protein